MVRKNRGREVGGQTQMAKWSTTIGLNRVAIGRVVNHFKWDVVGTFLRSRSEGYARWVVYEKQGYNKYLS
ncbi:hypothetical protein GOBAR_DD10605 [Gossypium barbadense]|nr:hypothetical protein GOBAR_DD10605 [Gossypium barbadense]